MNKRIQKKLIKVAGELPLFPVFVAKTKKMTAEEFVEHVKSKYPDGEEIPDSKFMVDGLDMRIPYNQKDKKGRHAYVVVRENEQEQVDHNKGVKDAYKKGGFSGVEVYCKEVTRYYLALQRKQRELNRSANQNAV